MSFSSNGIKQPEFAIATGIQNEDVVECESRSVEGRMCMLFGGFHATVQRTVNLHKESHYLPSMSAYVL